MSDSKERIIKRYSNRKLYDTEASSYITLSEIGQLVHDGFDIRVVDHKTGEDLTSVTMAQILVENGKKQRRTGLPAQALRSLLEQGEDALDYLRETVENVRSEAEKGMDWFEKSIQEKLPAADEVTRNLKELFRSSQESITDWQRQADAKMEKLLSRLSTVTDLKKEVSRLSGLAKKFEERLDNLEKREQKRK